MNEFLARKIELEEERARAEAEAEQYLSLKETWKSTLIDGTLDKLVQNTLQTELVNLSNSTIQDEYAEFKRTIKSRLIENLTLQIIEQLTVFGFFLTLHYH